MEILSLEVRVARQDQEVATLPGADGGGGQVEVIGISHCTRYFRVWRGFVELAIDGSLETAIMIVDGSVDRVAFVI